MRLHQSITLIAIALLFTGCAKIYGIRTKHVPNDREVESSHKRWCDNCLHGTLNLAWFDEVDSLTTLNADTSVFNKFRHARMQPLSMSIYEDETEIFFTSNCLAGGFPNLKWSNTGNYTEEWPQPHSFVAPHVGALHTRSQHLKHVRFISPNNVQPKHLMVMHVTTNMRRQSKRMVQFFTDQVKLKEDVAILVVHTPYFQKLL